MIVAKKGEQDILVVSENGFGKRSDLDNYRITNRGGKGVKTINITEKTGKLIAIKAVTDDDDLMIITTAGIAIRVSVSSLRIMGRNTQGVKLINLRDGDRIAAATQVPSNNADLEEDTDNSAGNNYPSETGESNIKTNESSEGNENIGDE
jgi:DNA gyrase subunit A